MEPYRIINNTASVLLNIPSIMIIMQTVLSFIVVTSVSLQLFLWMEGQGSPLRNQDIVFSGDYLNESTKYRVIVCRLAWRGRSIYAS